MHREMHFKLHGTHLKHICVVQNCTIYLALVRAKAFLCAKVWIMNERCGSLIQGIEKWCQD